MRSKMLGLAIALSTFGLGVAATTYWIARHTPAPAALAQTETRYVFVAEPSDSHAAAESSIPCAASASSANSGKPIRGGILQGKAISKPQPVYPPVARAEGVTGTVQVEVVVDECGGVESARAISGPALLQQAAVDAAMKMRYTPTRLSGQPVKISGTVAYNFLLQ